MNLPQVHRQQPASEGVAAYRIDSQYSWNGEHFRIFLEINELRTKQADKTAAPPETVAVA
jgi:hypothetical protein